jgi:hypothetical protein
MFGRELNRRVHDRHNDTPCGLCLYCYRAGLCRASDAAKERSWDSQAHPSLLHCPSPRVGAKLVFALLNQTTEDSYASLPTMEHFPARPERSAAESKGVESDPAHASTLPFP